MEFRRTTGSGRRIARATALIIAVGAVTGILAGLVTRGLVNRQARAEIDGHAVQTADTIRDISTPIIDAAGQILPVVRTTSNEDLSAMMAAFVEDFPLLRSVALVQRDSGTITVGNGPRPRSLDQLDLSSGAPALQTTGFIFESPGQKHVLVFGGSFPVPGDDSLLLVGEMTVNRDWLALLSNDAGTGVQLTYEFEDSEGNRTPLFATDMDAMSPMATERINFGGNGNELVIIASATSSTLSTAERLAPWSVGLIVALTAVVAAVGVEVVRRRGREYERLQAEASRLDEALGERLRIEEELAHRAFHDPLTGLPNRSWFMERARTELSPGPTAMFFIDLDGFKVVNDSLGHQLGDRLLVAIAQRLEAAIDPGALVIRFGGDEFVVLSSSPADPDSIERQADSIRAAVSPALQISGETVFVTASIGVRLIDGAISTPEDLLRDADVAMYAAKELGRDRHVVFDEDLRDRAVERLQLDTDLRQALDEDEFLIEYQPVVDITSREVIGAEALLRWAHPERGVLLPDQFLPVFADSSLLADVDAWVIDRVTEQLRAWQDVGIDLSLAVNLSGVTLLRPDLVEFIGRRLAECGLRPGSLVLELTERRLVRRGDGFRLKELQEAGAAISIDDFGTGYSALSYLRDLPVDVVKLDRSFVSPLAHDDRTLAIVKAILMLTGELGVATIAEGVETEEQAEILAALGCHAMQGTLMSAPVAPSVLLDRAGQV